MMLNFKYIDWKFACASFIFLNSTKEVEQKGDGYDDVKFMLQKVFQTL